VFVATNLHGLLGPLCVCPNSKPSNKAGCNPLAPNTWPINILQLSPNNSQISSSYSFFFNRY